MYRNQEIPCSGKEMCRNQEIPCSGKEERHLVLQEIETVVEVNSLG